MSRPRQRAQAVLKHWSNAIRVGTAGWTIPRERRDVFAADGSSLERYAARFHCAEINSSFHRSHRPTTYARWAASVPETFRFSVKLPKEITHKRKLVDCRDLLDVFIAETSKLGEKLGIYVVQLAPRHEYNESIAAPFFESLRQVYGGGLACEPRHPSWTSPDALALFSKYRVTRIGVDPAIFAGGEISEPYGGFYYYRWHGAPRTYYSAYDETRLKEFAATVRGTSASDVWCIFDNTASGAAVPDALSLIELLMP